MNCDKLVAVPRSLLCRVPLYFVITIHVILLLLVVVVGNDLKTTGNDLERMFCVKSKINL